MAMAGPTSLSPNFCELRLPDQVALCKNRRKAMEENRVQFDLEITTLQKTQVIDKRNIAISFRVMKRILVHLYLVRRCKYREENTMSNELVAPETKGVTVKIITTVDLGPEIEGMQGRQLRMRMVTIEPGGVFGPIHDHKDRPGIVYILQGSITDHRNGIATDYGPGLGWPEDRLTLHWLENRGTIPAVEISVDIVRQE